MPFPINERLFERLITPLRSLRDSAITLEKSLAAEIQLIEPAYRDSARNLLHYLSLRQNDIRNLQQDLASLGLSSLGVLESNTLWSLNTVLTLLERVTGKEISKVPAPPVDFRTGPLLLRDHTQALLGQNPPNRYVRIMVTMPSEAATDPKVVEGLLASGMDVMRINCAHDNADAWKAMVENLRRAEDIVGRTCKVQADLGGPKLRTGPIKPSGRMLKLKPRRDAMGRLVAPSQVWLTPTEQPRPAPEDVNFVVSINRDALGKVQVGDTLQIRDTRDKQRKMRILAAQEGSLLAEVDRPTYVAEDATVHFLRNKKLIAEGRVGALPEVVVPIVLFPGDTLVLTRDPKPGADALRDEADNIIEPAHIHCTLEAAFESTQPNQPVWFDDGKIGGIVRANDGRNIRIEITHTAPVGGKLRAEKGINFPATALNVSALTAKDLADLEQVYKYVDMVALSFLRTPEDVLLLEDHLHRLGEGHLGIILKVENRQAFENLPRILLSALRSPPVGVMVARGDLAVEMGFERLSEVQEEILWLCEAAHVPVIWATQILEGLAKTGSPSRAEVTDAAMSSRAECAMLNKGPNIVETVAFLRGVLRRMGTHQYKRKALLRKLNVSVLK